MAKRVAYIFFTFLCFSLSFEANATTTGRISTTSPDQLTSQFTIKQKTSALVSSSSPGGTITTTTHLASSTGQSATNQTNHTSDTTTAEANTTTFGVNVSSSTASNVSTAALQTSNTMVNSTVNIQVDTSTSRSFRNTGLITVVCVFVAILVIGLVIVITKGCQSGKPEFKRLDEVPMSNVNEKSPFAQQPPK
ncbi:protein CIST1-like isoform X1 [Latimeria chalumnae]|uniref:protein CIST1-like isoform X1 n=1 Tax=Latimeria chalumnae TaxID=7897 RepID=UPI0003C1115E|nr:PREDICTED: putative GPI-anchored protein PB15E9.01c isoform X1 [Latimeria chalumnae]|eukprot:XP_005993214.1 PREDICTED: putative GPI-anchored protein PB15E9.01c isoform X1 [Latimeria chalumnae]